MFVTSLAVLPFWFPFAVAMLFGNLDTLFLALYGLVLLAVLERTPSRGTVLWAGLALAVASVTKLHPAVLGVWLLARGVREWRRDEPRMSMLGIALPRSWAIAAVAAVTVLVILAASLIVGGLGPWADYLTVLRASTVVDLLDPRNLGPAVQVALLFGLGSGSLAALQAVVLAIALATAILAALRGGRPAREPAVGRVRVAGPAAGDLVPPFRRAVPVRCRGRCAVVDRLTPGRGAGSSGWRAWRSRSV